MKKIQLTKWQMTFIIIGVLLIVLHLTPKLALRAHVFFTGHILSSVTTRIIPDKMHNQLDKKTLEHQHAACYSLTKPPVELATKGILTNWKVRRFGIFYFASYYGDV